MSKSSLPSGTVMSRAKANTTKRQKIKAKWDRHCKYGVEDIDSLPKQFSMDGQNFSVENLNTESENWCRLLDEGVVVDNSFWTGEPYAYAVIEKGVVKQWYNSLPNNFVGHIDKDHNRSIGLGTFTKKDLRLVETENGRYAVDVNVKLDHELYAVKDLLRENNRTALSVEMFINADEYAKASKVTGNDDDDYLVPLISDLKIEGYAVCIAPKSANSYKDGLLEKATVTNTNDKEEFTMGDDEVKTTDTTVEKTTEVEASAGGPAPEAEVTETEVEETVAEETTDGGDEAEVTETEVEETETTEPETEGESKGDNAEETLSAIKEQIEKLKADLAERDAKIADLEEKLSAKQTEKADFEAKLSSILDFASSDEPTTEEGATPEKTDGDEVVDAYAAAFNNLENA